MLTRALTRLKARLIDDEPFVAQLPVSWFREPSLWVAATTGRGGFKVANRPDAIKVAYSGFVDTLATGSPLHAFVGARPADLPESGTVRVTGVLRVRFNIKLAFWVSLLIAAASLGMALIAAFDVLVLRGATATEFAREVFLWSGLGLVIATGGLASIALVRWLQSGQRARLDELRAPPP